MKKKVPPFAISVVDMSKSLSSAKKASIKLSEQAQSDIHRAMDAMAEAKHYIVHAANAKDVTKNALRHIDAALSELNELSKPVKS